jgi:hypothetical protein
MFVIIDSVLYEIRPMSDDIGYPGVRRSWRCLGGCWKEDAICSERARAEWNLE